MKVRLPITLAVAPVGFLVGALIVGRPVSVPNDLVLDPTMVVTTAPNEVAPPATDAPSATDAVDETSTGLSTTSTAVTSTSSLAPAEPVDLGARVVVANATALSGVASRNATILVAAGFNDTATADAASVEVSVVYAREGFESTAAEIAQLLELPSDVPQPFPDDEITPLDADADVLVVIGVDRGGVE